MLTWEELGKKIGATTEELEQIRYLDYLQLSEAMFVEMAKWCVEYNRRKGRIVQALFERKKIRLVNCEVPVGVPIIIQKLRAGRYGYRRITYKRVEGIISNGPLHGNDASKESKEQWESQNPVG